MLCLCYYQTDKVSFHKIGQCIKKGYVNCNINVLTLAAIRWPLKEYYVTVSAVMNSMTIVIFASTTNNVAYGNEVFMAKYQSSWQNYWLHPTLTDHEYKRLSIESHSYLAKNWLNQSTYTTEISQTNLMKGSCDTSQILCYCCRFLDREVTDKSKLGYNGLCIDKIMKK